MSDIQYPVTGKKNINLKSTDLCGNTRNEVRQVDIIQQLIAGQYVRFTEDGQTLIINVDPSSDYYNKYQINELFADLDTVKFKIVDTLPAAGAENVIYLVEKTAPETGYNQYIWSTEDMDFYPIGDTDIDLSDYYTKLQADDKFQEKLSDGTTVSTVSDSTEFSQIDLSAKTVNKTTGSAIWNYIKSKFSSSSVSSVQDDTRISGLDLTQANPNQYFTAADLKEYVTDSIEGTSIDAVQDNTRISGLNFSDDPPNKWFYASSLYAYMKRKLTYNTTTALSDNSTLTNVYLATDTITQVTMQTMFDYMWKKIYPVGSIYISIDATSPQTLFGGSWTQITDGYYLRASTNQGGTYLDAELPNIKGEYTLELTGNASSSGALRSTKEAGGRAPNWTGDNSWGKLYLDASRMTNSVYKDNGAVQPKSLKVYMWKRTA